MGTFGDGCGAAEGCGRDPPVGWCSVGGVSVGRGVQCGGERQCSVCDDDLDCRS